MVLIDLDNGEITDEYILYNHNSMKQQIQTALDNGFDAEIDLILVRISIIISTLI